ncbi:elongation factor Ts [Labrys sp. LIt4]|uniref:Elongation factor Ts n=1 Tax=Labrys okinawensis TaxID=346911 RepID=A0A2S9Q6V3_9HYPH|nr:MULTISPECIES: translation elongation factor Ts [Labrys]MBP0578970.1 elongation factor Ts [Labrys sp. LIt4]PRH85093.1 elongation factor Ts [Labrys okinawensis]
MSNITAAMVKELREQTGAGMMDCKAALTETAGDLEAAVDWLRKKGLSKAAKKAGRVAAEGLVALLVEGNKGVAVEVNSETDFVARNPEFQDLVSGIAEVALNTGEDVEALKAAAFPGGGTVEEKISATVAKIGENMSLRRAKIVSVGQGALATYVHNPVVANKGRIGVIVALESAGNAEKLAELGRQIAMHVASSNPVAVDAAGVDAATVEREKTILAEKYREQGKPEAAIAKIVESGIKTYFKEVTLLEQPFIFDPSKSVGQAIKESEGAAGGPIKVAGFIRYALGEGIEKQESDFAAEVAAQAGHAA